MKPPRDWLAHGIEKFIHEHSRPAPGAESTDFDVVIVGSGYGGAVAASRFARAVDDKGRGLRVCVLERGREFLPGDFPARFSDLPDEVRFSREKKLDDLTGEALGLLNFRFDEDLQVLTGNGLGGGSLINAGVTERATDDVWNDPAWPAALRNDSGGLATYYERAEKMLCAQPMPQSAWPEKTRQMEKLAERLARSEPHAPSRFRAVKAAINLQERTNDYGIKQLECLQCGDCFTGCNFNAKNTLATNYLPDARRFGAEMYTGATVSFVQHVKADHDEYWRVWFILSDTKSTPSRQVSYFMTAKKVVLAAGSLGSTEILKRSEKNGLTLSRKLGTRFSGNGDMIWAGFKQSERVHVSVAETTPYGQRRVGPTITSMVDLRSTPVRGAIQDAAIPASMYRAFSELVTTSGLLYRMTEFSNRSDDDKRDPDAVNPEHIDHTAVYLTMGRDKTYGTIEYKDDCQRNDGLSGRIRIEWKDAAASDVYTWAERTLKAGVEELGGTLIPNPLWRAYPQKLADVLSGAKPRGTVLTVHPLGGCPMGASFEHGVVDDAGAVFAGPEGTVTHAGLFVLDGSIIPVSLGINPLLTITALAERAMEKILKNAGLRSGVERGIPEENKNAPTSMSAPAPATLVPPAPRGTQATFTENMYGDMTISAGQTVASRSLADWTRWPAGASVQAALSVDFHFKEEVAAFLANPRRSIRIDSARMSVAIEKFRQEEKYELEGTVEWLTEIRSGMPSRIARGLRSYCRLRGWDDLLSRYKDGTLLKSASSLGGYFKLASHTGTKRLLKYELAPKNGQGWKLVGVKHVEYAVDNNLWRSISDLHTEIIHADGRTVLAKGVVSLDWRDAFAARSFQINAPDGEQPCENMPYAWLDLASMFAFFARAMLRIHFWSLRKPDYEPEKRTFPLPGKLPGLQEPEWHCVPFDSTDDKGKPVKVAIGLTKYRKENMPPDPARLPVMMIHGFGASGLQYATPLLDENLVQHLCAQGRDVWVLDLRTSIALPTSDDQWTLDDIACEDIPKAVDYVLSQYAEQQLKKIDVLAHCIGSAMFNVAVLSGNLHNRETDESKIRTAVMLQVGPIFTVSKSNRIRGSAAAMLVNAADLDSTDSSVDETSADWKDVLFDRLLSTYPLPQSEVDALRSRRWKPGNLFAIFTDVANYLRSAAVFGRLFQFENLSSKMRHGLGSLLGATNMRTYRQILKSVLVDRLVDRYGRSIYVNDDNFRAYYRFDARFLYGELNDVFSSVGLKKSQELLSDCLPEHVFNYVEIQGYGHLDPLVGEHSSRDVYPRISEFFANPYAFATPLPADSLGMRSRPAVGPVIGWTRMEVVNRFGNNDEKPVVRVWVKANDLRNPPSAVEIILVDQSGNYVDDSYRLYGIVDIPRFKVAVCDVVLPDADNEYSMVVCTKNEGFYVEPTVKDLHMAGQSFPFPVDPLTHHIDISRLQEFVPPTPEHSAGRPGPGVTFPGTASAMTKTAEPNQEDFAGRHGPGEPLPDAATIMEKLETLPEGKVPDAADKGNYRVLLGMYRAYARALENRKDKTKDIDPASFAVTKVTKRSLRALKAPPSSPVDALSFALGSCRYSGTPIEENLADRAFASLRRHIDGTPEPEQPAFAFMMGDQIYADATAGVFEKFTLLELLIERYNVAFTSPQARKLMSMLPSYMMLDDHEILNDMDTGSYIGDDEKEKWNEVAKAAFATYQWAHSPRNAQEHLPDNKQDDRFWYTFDCGGFPFFVMDTRLERDRRPAPGEDDSAKLVSDAQMKALEKWLQDCQTESGDRPKFVVSPSMLAPITLDQACETAYRNRNDGWHAYPRSLRQLAGILLGEKGETGSGIRNVVFLSGDPHSSYASRLTFSRDGVSAEAHALVVSPLYAPYPFANLHARDFAKQHGETLTPADEPVDFAYDLLWQDDTHQGFGLLSVSLAEGEWQLKLKLLDAAEAPLLIRLADKTQPGALLAPENGLRDSALETTSPN